MTAPTSATPVLETDRLRLRAPDRRDEPAVLAFFASERARFYGGPLSENDGWHKFAAYVGQWTLRGYGFFAITGRETGATLGLAGPHHPAHFAEPEMSWLLSDDKDEGKGLAREACAAVLNHVFAAHGWASVVSYIDPENTASRRLAKRLGARLDPGAEVPMPGCDAFRHFAPEGAA